eukprot:Em0015g61a
MQSKWAARLSSAQRAQINVLKWLQERLIWHCYTLCLFLHVCAVIVVTGFNSLIYHQLPLLRTLQMYLHRKLPSRVLSKTVGKLAARPLSPLMKRMVLGSYVRMFGCKMEEAVEEDINQYTSLLSLFTRTLKEEARPINADHPLVSPADGTVIYVGRIEDGLVKEVKGITYSLDEFLGPGVCDSEELEFIDRVKHKNGAENFRVQPSRAKFFSNMDEDLELPAMKSCPRKGNELFCVVMYLSPGDYHHFHSPAEWTATLQRHFSGELLTVAPWAMKALPGLLTLNERVLLSGYWEHGFFSYTAVGALNVGSIKMDFDKELQSNQEGHCKHCYVDKQLGVIDGVTVQKGQHLGHFEFGSSVVLVFEAPSAFTFSAAAGSRLQFGQPLGRVAGQSHMESDLE